MNQSTFIQGLKRLVLLVWSQRALRMLLRAAWLGGGGYLLALSINAQSGRLPHQWQHFALAALLAAPALARVVWPIVRPGRLAWRMDRLYGFNEQVTTAWEVSARAAIGSLSEPLVDDAGSLLSQAQRRILRRGWSLAPDALSLLIIGALLYLIVGPWLQTPSLTAPASELAALPPLGSDPDAEQIVPSGIPGLVPTPTPTPPPPTPDAGNMGEAGGDGGQSGQDGAPDTEGTEGAEGGEHGDGPKGTGAGSGSSLAMGNALDGLGQTMAQEGVSHEAGRALQRRQYEDAAQQMETLADQLDQFGSQTIEQLAQAFEDAAEKLGQETDELAQQMAQNMQELADSLNAGDTRSAERAMDQLAGDLRSLEQQMAEGGSAVGDEEGPPATDRSSGTVQDIDRLYGDSGDFALSELGESGGLLSGNMTAEAQNEASGEASGAALSGDNTVVDSILLPSPFSWQWRDVVSRYFTRR